MNSGGVRNTGFSPAFQSGYGKSKFDDLLLRLAAELDAGRPVGPLINGATLPTKDQELFLPHGEVAGAYDVDAVDWFLEELVRQEAQPALGEMSADGWRDLPVVNQFTWRGPGGRVGPPSGSRSWESRREYRAAAREYLAEECVGAWRDFGQLPGEHLEWVHVGPSRSELRTAGQQVRANYRDPWSTTVSTGGMTFTVKDIGRKRYLALGLHEIAARAAQDDWGHFNVKTTSRVQQVREDKGLWRGPSGLKELVDEMGTPVLYITGSRHFARRAGTGIAFPDGRWLRFLVRGTEVANAIMTAVDQAGNRIVRYRVIGGGRNSKTEIIVNPGWRLIDELVLAIAISVRWLESYFLTSSS